VKIHAGFGGATVGPGNYRARVTTGDASAETAFSLAMDPRITATPEQISEWSARVAETAGLMDEVLKRLGEARKSRLEIEALLKDHPQDVFLQDSGKAAVAAITYWDHKLNQHLQQTYEDEDAWETMLAGQIRYLLDVIDGTGAPVTGGAMERLADLKNEWSLRAAELREIKTSQIDAINEWAREKGVPHVAEPGI
jgi:hypothetical protein